MSEIQGQQSPDSRMESVRIGQQLIIISIIIYLVAPLINNYIPLFGSFIAMLAGLAGLILSLVGLYRISEGIPSSTAIKILVIIALIIPLIGLIALVLVNLKATKVLREAGYHVGLMGANKL